jgi:REP element-mobilizing transposase RayT
MPRSVRLHVPGGFYHVVLRGNHREALFSTADDRQILNDIVADSIGRHGARAHAFCWMSNHLHALLQIDHSPLGAIMQRIAMRYARHRHKTLRTTGHLFERRYRARLIRTDQYFLAALRYIHLNPVAARMVTDPEHYQWSSHQAYLGSAAVPWITTDFGLSLFGADPSRARAAYVRFLDQDAADPDGRTRPDWEFATEPKALPLDEVSLPKDPAIAPLRNHSAMTLEELASRICPAHRISPDRLRSTSRARDLTSVRVDFITQAIDLRIATLTELARFLNRDPSALTKLLARHRPPPHVDP